jgi:hypothetical protein
MKRKAVHFEKEAQDYSSTALKKQKTVHLSDLQKRTADKTIPYLLEEGKENLITTALEMTFKTPKKVESLLAYTNYQMFWWTIEHQDFELMQYILDKTTERGKFLIVCHNNYEIIKKFTDFYIEKIKDDSYQSLSATKTLKILLDANPNKSDSIIEIVKNFIDDNALNNFEAANQLKMDLKAVAPDIINQENVEHISTDEICFGSPSYDTTLETAVAGELPSNHDNS